jgi:ABC-type Fe3+-hydroxamate transport system substrate-binding protein
VLLLISDQDRNLYAARPESYTGLIADTLGLVNEAAGLPDSGPYPGFALMSIEAILTANPDVIVTITPAPAPAPRLSDSIRQIPPFAGLTAIRGGNVIEADVTLFLQSPGPRIVEAVEFLKDAISAE